MKLNQHLPSYKMSLVSTEYVKNQSLVRIRQTDVSVAGPVCQVQLALQGFKGHSRLFCHGLDVHGLVGLKANDELVATTLPTKNVPRNVTELDTNFGLSFVQSCEQIKQLIVNFLVHDCTACTSGYGKGSTNFNAQ